MTTPFAASPVIARLLFFAILLAICSWHIEAAPDDNTVSRALAVRALVEEGTLEITAHHMLTGDKAITGDRYFSDKAPLPTFIVAGLWKCARVIGLVDLHEDPVDARILMLGGFLFGSVPMALILLIAFVELRRIRPEAPWLLAIVPLLGSFLFVYSGTFFNHLPAALFALLAALGIRAGKHMRAGILAGLGVACDAALLFVLAAWLAQLAFSHRRALRPFVTGLLPGAAFTMANNFAVTGSPLTFPSAHAVNYGVMREGYGFGTWQPEAFLGLTVSAYRGLLFYAPALISLILLAIAERARLTQRAMLTDPFLLPTAALVLVFFTHATWWGGWAYGPRYLTPVPVLLLVRAMPALAMRPWHSRAAIALGSAGLMCAVAAKLTTGHGLPTGMKDPLVSMVLPLVRERAFYGAGWPVQAGFSPTMGAFLFCLALVLAYFGARRITRTA
ncbi:MAG: hypothetical protein IPK70_10030 [Flavobacteriales bacterium]|jgi:hypothetical protein|nr:hypothetical protein [Flavobacteriales bacterium]